MVLTYRYRLLPTKRQHRALESLLESQRELYNAALEERIGAFRQGVKRHYFDQAKALTLWRHSDTDAASYPVSLQRGTLKRLDNAYKAFYRRCELTSTKPGFPRFRGRGWWKSFAFAAFEGITLRRGRLRFKRMPGALRVHMHRPLPSPLVIKTCIFKRDADGWFVNFTVSVEPAPFRGGRRKVGVDLGIKSFAALSDGGRIPGLRAARRAERRLRLAQRALARKLAGSKCRATARPAVGRAHAKIVKCRRNFLHQASARLIRDYDVVVVESLNIKGLARGLLSRDVHDASWGTFISMLRYKAERAGALVIEVDPFFTSRDCSGCGAAVDKVLQERLHQCPTCGLSMDRDLNAARNILGRAGMGPGLPNVALENGKRAGENTGSSPSSEGRLE